MKKISKYIILILTITILLCSCGNQKNTTDEEIELGAIQKICDLATLECRFLNVGVHEVPEKEGYKSFISEDTKLWAEYTDTVKYIIDASKIDIEIHDLDITVKIPKVQAVVIGNPELNKDSFVYSKNGLWININKLDPAEAESIVLEKATNEMLEVANNSTDLINTARKNAEELISSYINAIGKRTGKEYKITFDVIE